MTITELEENVRRLKIKKSRIHCNLIKVHDNLSDNISEIGIYVTKNNDKWEVYQTERRIAELICIFYKENDAYEYVYCHLKKIADEDCWWFGGWMNDYPKNLIDKMKRLKIPDFEYSFEGDTQKNAFVLKNVYKGDRLHNVLNSDEYDIKTDYLKKDNGKVVTWEVYYSDGIEKEKYSVFFQEKNAYDFLFYLVMKKYISIKKHWWYL